MSFYWRLKDIPELRDVPATDRRRLWREAVTRSHTVRGVLLMAASLLGIVGTVELVTLGMLRGREPLHGIAVFIALYVALLINGYALTQPRARRWLRQHA
ncbi:MAG: hypothetical protein WA777_04275 [Rhodanobacter sp.]